MLKFCLFITLLFSTTSTLALPVVRASVSPDFPNGLHSKYLTYLCKQLDVELSIEPMPLARRLKELRKGNLDLLVLSRMDSRDLIYLQPAYESLRTGLFVRLDDQQKLSDFASMQTFKVGYSIGTKLFPRFDQDTGLQKVAVSSLQQKILLLEKGRIDAFLQAVQSTQQQLIKMDKHTEIVKARWQPQYQRDYHFVISEKSELYAHRQRVITIIKQALTTGQFAKIRQQYYQ